MGNKNNAKDFDVEIQYRDGGGCYEGTEDLCESDIEIKHTNGETWLFYRP